MPFPDKSELKFPQQPRGGRHLYAVARFDRDFNGDDRKEAFVLTRGYWNESEANAAAVRLNADSPATTEYFVLPVRVSTA